MMLLDLDPDPCGELFTKISDSALVFPKIKGCSLTLLRYYCSEKFVHFLIFKGTKISFWRGLDLDPLQILA
jgi:hypothetical protein